MKKEWLETIVSRGSVLINTSISELTREAKAELRIVDLDRSGIKYMISPPSRTLTLAVILVALMLWGSAALIMYRAWKTPAASPGAVTILLTSVFSLLGLLAMIPGIRMLLKRLRRNKYYLYCGDSCIIERFPGRVTVIPESKIRYAFERRSSTAGANDIYFDSIVYARKGKDHLYDLQDHYFLHPERKRVRHDNLYRIIRKKYSAEEPPANSPFAHQSF